jgi:hypothetical protein
LRSQKNVFALRRGLDPAQDHFNVVNLVFLLLSRLFAALLLTQVPLELIYAVPSPSATRIRTEDPRRKVK